MPVQCLEEKAIDLVVKALAFQFGDKLGMHLRNMRMRLQHVWVPVAENILDHAVLVRLKARRRAKRFAKARVVGRRHRAQDIPGAVELFENAAHPGQHLEHFRRPARANFHTCREKLVQGQFSSKARWSGAGR